MMSGSNNNKNKTQRKCFGIFVIIALFAITISGCHQNQINDSPASICISLSKNKSAGSSTAIINNDTLQIEKIVVSSKEENKVLTHFNDICNEQIIDLKVISDNVNHHRWHAFRVALLWVSIVLIVFLFICIIWQWLHLLFSRQYRQTYRYQHLGLQTAAYITLISGCVMYYIGFFKTGTASSVIAYFVRPLIASLGMFVGNTSYQEVCEECTNSPVYMTFFGIIHFAAITISAVVVINFFWKRLSSFFIRKWWWIQSVILKQKKSVNVFFGSNEPSFILTREMLEKGERIVFIDSPSNGNEKSQQMSLSQIFGMFPYDRELMRQLKGRHCIVMNTTYDIAKDDKDNEFILDKLGIGHLRTIINYSGIVRIFFLSENAQNNIKSVINIQDDYVFRHPNCQIDIYAHAPRNNHNIALERKNRKKEEYAQKPAIHIIDSSYLAVQWLKINPKYHPVQFVKQTKEEQKRGVVNDEFNALVVGFGETGQEALAFLYEFGAFVNDKHVRSPFCCYIAETSARSLKGEFYMNRPALEGKKEIVFMGVSDKDENYWSQIKTKMQKLQYIVVSTGADESNMKIAIDLYQLAISCRKNDLSRFKIFVRSHFQRNESWMERISSYYNSNNQSSLGEIVIFGKMSDIYTYDNIVADKVLREAIEYGNNYYEAFQNLERIVGKEEMELTGLARIRKNHRSLSQDIANSLHASTKFLLMGLNEKMLKRLFTSSDLTEQEQKTKSMLIEISNYSENNEFIFEKDSKKMEGDEVKTLIYNIAMCEHLRWNAAHEIMGYTLGDERNEILKQHDCLTDFSDLPKFPQNPNYDKGDYDFLVLETSIKLKMKEYGK